MKIYFVAYLSSLLSFIVIDGIWLSLAMSRLFKTHLAHLLADKVNLWPAAIFYLLYPAGIYFFVVGPSLANDWPCSRTLFSGLFLGLLAYSAYDLTNHATLRGWPITITLIDMAWGSALTGLVSVISVWLTKKLLF